MIHSTASRITRTSGAPPGFKLQTDEMHSAAVRPLCRTGRGPGIPRTSTLRGQLQPQGSNTPIGPHASRMVRSFASTAARSTPRRRGARTKGCTRTAIGGSPHTIYCCLVSRGDSHLPHSARQLLRRQVPTFHLNQLLGFYWP